MKTRRCLVCGSDEVFLWLGGSIGELYHCPECQYVGPIVLEGEEESFRDQPVANKEELERVFGVQAGTLAGEDLF